LVLQPNGHIPFDYHIHSNASCDSHATMAEMCRAALDKGILEIGFAEHFDLHPQDFCFAFYKPEVFFENLEAARQEFGPQGLTIRAGVEVGELHRYRAAVQPILDAWPYDYVLGSLHWNGDHSIFDPDYFRAYSPREVITVYFNELAEMVRGGGFDVLAHPDVFKRTAYTVYGHFDTAEWEDLVRPVWQACIETGIGIEINSSGLRLAVGEVHPALEALRWYRDMGGERLTVGSDSHRPEHLGFGLETALQVAREAGFTRLCGFERRQITRWIVI
jgi:histidinol-phosphatase (PHP family)